MPEIKISQLLHRVNVLELFHSLNGNEDKDDTCPPATFFVSEAYEDYQIQNEWR